MLPGTALDSIDEYFSEYTDVVFVNTICPYVSYVDRDPDCRHFVASRHLPQAHKKTVLNYVDAIQNFEST